jgi:hypothetical protein
MWIRYRKPDWSSWVTIRVHRNDYDATVATLVAQGYLVEGA